MLFRIFMVLVGFGLAVSGGVSTIAYMNLLAAGYGIEQFFSFIITRVECYLLPIGILLIWISIYFPGDRQG